MNTIDAPTITLEFPATWRNVRFEMAQLKDIQLAFYDMMDVIDAGGPWIFTVYPDGDARVQGDSWQQDGNTVYMSDPLYALVCRHEGIQDVNYRGEKKS